MAIDPPILCAKGPPKNGTKGTEFEQNLAEASFFIADGLRNHRHRINFQQKHSAPRARAGNYGFEGY
jgi:hypothetical protein